ncbi:MAG: 2-oxoglutarate dehydrogenase complex dihydrolipoyllysine-residue succinyltransferase [Bacteroidetes bacterium]|nr:2-oxoglutarate dehydrogenase complex dihydrolipoyllysine-residue succinyltransferase [Bacteroidota bacterium]
MAIEIKVPAPGESVSEVTIANWLVKEGEWVEMDAPLAEFESDKATFEVNAEKTGVIEKLIGNIGDTIAINTVIAVINTDAERPASAAPKAEVAAVKATAEATPSKAVESKTESTKETVAAKSENHAQSSDADWSLVSPVAAQLLQQYNISPSQVKGTGAGGRVTKVDALEAIVAMGGVAVQSVGSRAERREKMSNLRKTVSRRLVAVKNETAMLTTFNEVNMKPIMDLRAQYKKKFEETHGVGLGFMSFFTRACCIALTEWKAVNASIDGDEIIYHDYCDVSIAVSAPKGLVVPVIRNAEKLSLDEIEKEVKRLATRARDNKLGLDEMTGGTFTITNGGVFGSMMSTPIINAPQSGILGMHNIVERPVVENGQIVIRPMMYLALSYDHRIIDGRESVSFLVRVKQLLENPQMMLDGKKPEERVLGL